MVTDFGRILKLFVDRQVEFIVVGGIAAIAHGAARATFDLDLVYSRNSDNLRRLSTALQPYQPYLRGAPPGLPFVWDERTIVNGLNFTLTTAIGDLIYWVKSRVAGHTINYCRTRLKFRCLA